MPLLAMAAGSAGDVLRLVRLRTGLWQLGDGRNATVEMLDHADHQETLWTKDIGTIRRIRAIVSTKRFEPLRWLAVQRDAGTSVFRPEYQKIPVVSERFSGTGPRAPSHVAPNLLFNIPKSQTGYDLHSDLAFNPGVKSKPPQLAIIDEGGNWSIWDISGTRNRTYKRPRARLGKCGNISKGAQKDLPRGQAVRQQWHRILWVGRDEPESEDDYSDEEEVPTTQPTSQFRPLDRSSTLLLCNARLLRLFDLETNSFLPDLRFLLDGNRETILDVSLDTQDPRYFYVVTTSRLFVAAQMANQDPIRQQAHKYASILQSFPHHRNRAGRDLKLRVHPGEPLPDCRTSVVLLYSSHSSWCDIFYITYPRKKPEQITCHRTALLSDSSLKRDIAGPLQTLWLNPIAVLNRGGAANTDGNRFIGNPTTRFYQLFSFGTDLSLNCCLCVSSDTAWTMGTLAMDRFFEAESVAVGDRPSRYTKKSEKLSRQEIERQKVVRYLSSHFVVPDSLAAFQYRGDGGFDDRIITRPIRLHKPPSSRRMVQPVYEQFHGILQQLWAEGGDDPLLEVDIYGAAPFDPVFVALQSALDTGLLPLKSMFEMVQDFRVPHDITETSEEWHTEIEQLRHADPGLTIMSLVKPKSSFSDLNSLEDLFRGLSLFQENESGEEIPGNLTLLASRRIACELYLSRFGMTYVPPEISEPPATASLDIRSSPPVMPEDMLIDSQESNRHSTPQEINRHSTISPSVQLDSQWSRASTPASTATSVATTPTGAGEGAEDRSLSMLRALTNSGKQPAVRKQPDPLQWWNEGEDPSQYVFSIDKNDEITPGMRRRAKQEAREARKRKRNETLLQLQREHLSAAASQPAFETRFHTQTSQPTSVDFSSQSRITSSAPPIITMSQPVAGMFGGRSDGERPKKKAKRKTGF